MVAPVTTATRLLLPPLLHLTSYIRYGAGWHLSLCMLSMQTIHYDPYFNYVFIWFYNLKIRPGTPGKGGTPKINGNGHRFLRKNSAKVRPSTTNNGVTKPQTIEVTVEIKPTSTGTGKSGNNDTYYQADSLAGGKPTITTSNTTNGSSSMMNQMMNHPKGVVTNWRRRGTAPSRASALLANIPVCMMQKCLIKYGCGHCLWIFCVFKIHFLSIAVLAGGAWCKYSQ